MTGATRGSLVPGTTASRFGSSVQWVERKVHYVDRAADISRVASATWRLAYVELFAGPGRSWDRGHRAFLDGSAIRALKTFREYVVDIDPAATAASQSASAAEADRPYHLTGDCNKVIDYVRPSARPPA